MPLSLATFRDQAILEHNVLLISAMAVQSRNELVRRRRDHPYGRSLRRWGTLPEMVAPISATIGPVVARICSRAGGDDLHRNVQLTIPCPCPDGMGFGHTQCNKASMPVKPVS